jgi:general secretion pathway protein A
MDSRNFLFLLLCGHPELEAKLRSAPLESLSRRLRIHFRTTALTLEETVKYVRHQMRQAGREAPLFSDESVARIYEHSRGLISQVNDLCFKAMLKAPIDGREIIEPTLVDSIHEG